MTGEKQVARNWFASAGARRYLAAFGLDQAADAMVYVLLAWVAVHGASALGAIWIVGAAAAAKLATLLLVGGALGDRFGAAPVVKSTLVIRSLLLVGLIAALAADVVLGIAVVAIAYGLVDGAHEPAMQALSTEVVPSDSGQKGIQGALDLVRRLGMLSAGPLVGAFIVWGSDEAAVALALVGLLAARLVVPAGTTRSRPAAERLLVLLSKLAADSREGWSVALRTKSVRSKLLIFVVANLALTPPIVLGVPLLAKAHHWSAAAFGLIDAGYAAGAIVGGIAVARWGDALSNAEEWAVGSLVPTAAAVAVLGWLDSWGLVCALAAVAGVSTGFGPSLLVGSLKESTPDHLQSRMQAARVAAIVAAGPAGIAVFGALISASSISAAITILAALLGLASILFLSGRAKELLLT
ncbi:hypothetical protein VV01_00185 [Luteipulveratus halotolerans]|uniref:Major facilitator superfamily (MFS) profile domain-containing protein n=2 Tax=Luteipulveratus halotolerans TaxID=1631356 RepID=A0A0L6CPJ4_9MICO|nr:hypothetical protein VV01_00185 [Luteipulveratus halotolerans]